MVEFPDGITLFEGDIGSGKSTILLAVEFALFGLGDTRPGHLLRHGASEGRVDLVFQVGDRRVRAVRTLKLRRTRAQQDRCTLEVDGEEEELAPADMKPRVLEVLGYNENPDPKARSDIFRYSVYTPQEDMRAILDTRKSMREQRKETLRRALGVQDYRQARDNLAVVVSEIKARSDRLEGMTARLDDVRERLVAAVEGLGVHRRELEATVGGLEEARGRERRALERVEELEGREAALRRAEREAEGLATRVAKARGQLEVLSTRVGAAREARGRLDETRTRLEEMGAVADELEVLETLDRKVRDLQAAYDRAVRELAGLKGEVTRAEEAAGEASSLEEQMERIGDPAPAIEEGKAELGRREGEVSGLRSAIAKLEGELELMEAEVEELSTLEGEARCPRCHQPLTEEHLEELMEGYRGRRNRLRSDMRVASSQALRLEDGMEEPRAELEGLRRAAGDRSVLARSLEKARERAATVEELRLRLEGHEGAELERRLAGAKERLDGDRLSQLRRLEGERQGLERHTRDLERAVEGLPDLEREMIGAEKALGGAEGECEEARKELERLGGEGIPEALREARGERDGAIRAHEALMASIRALEDRVRRGEEGVADLEGERTRLKGLAQSLQVHRHLHGWLTQCLRPALEDIERAVMAIMREEMDAGARGWFDLLVDDPDLELSVDGDFVPTVEQQGWDVDVAALSGGERTAVAFAYRLALNGLVRRVATPGQRNLLMLDEPTDGFSREQLMRMGTVLRELDADQVVIVSHDQELEAFADRVYVVRKAGGTSHVSLPDRGATRP